MVDARSLINAHQSAFPEEGILTRQICKQKIENNVTEVRVDVTIFIPRSGLPTGHQRNYIKFI